METFLQSSGIPHCTPRSEDFSSLQTSYSGVHQDKTPSVVVLPESPQQVADTVKQAIASNLRIVVRGGGHDSFGRWTVAGAVLLDLRSLNKVVVNAKSQTACVFGGATILQVLESLQDKGFQAAAGACGTVGYAGWALVGGMGPFMNSYGLGADQIIGAKVVNANGELVDANDRLLKGLRGGGGSLAIITELYIKIHPLGDIQSGILIHDSANIHKATTTFFTNFAALLEEHQGKLPLKLGIAPGVFSIPSLGPVSGVIIVWNGPVDNESKQWIGRIACCAPLMPGAPDAQSAVATTTAYGFISYLNTMLPATVTGRCHSASVSSFTPEVITYLAESAAKIPSGFTGGLNMHILYPHGPSCIGDIPSSVLPYRKPHIMFELLGFGGNKESSQQAAQWACEARNRFYESKTSLEGTYLPLTAPEFLDLEKTYGAHLAELRKIKAEFDPDGVFKHTVPALI
ncbi:hypothetical protein QQS21_007185 [Conoideocrella luteorostrata]|uniref:FAD-binding PCMH-type domain-containing protein n=1 Tax=Conoideocrella luteorostrata TaxID=1105319 RepID=A0AAJ0CL62_9HYPO|nr:hypothetical protein QQS21_007185 [Conoideocrella luteorostrata]